MNRTSWCQKHEVLEEVVSILKIEQAKEFAPIYSGETVAGCRVRFVSSLPWKKS